MTAESILRKTFFIHSGNIAISSDLTLRGYVRTVLKNDSKSFSSKRLYIISRISGLGVGATKFLWNFITSFNDTSSISNRLLNIGISAMTLGVFKIRQDTPFFEKNQEVSTLYPKITNCYISYTLWSAIRTTVTTFTICITFKKMIIIRVYDTTSRFCFCFRFYFNI